MSHPTIEPRRHVSEYSLTEVVALLSQAAACSDLAAVNALANHIIMRLRPFGGNRGSNRSPKAERAVENAAR